jgi:hypothetical protein
MAVLTGAATDLTPTASPGRPEPQQAHSDEQAPRFAAPMADPRRRILEADRGVDSAQSAFRQAQNDAEAHYRQNKIRSYVDADSTVRAQNPAESYVPKSDKPDEFRAPIGTMRYSGLEELRRFQGGATAKPEKPKDPQAEALARVEQAKRNAEETRLAAMEGQAKAADAQKARKAEMEKDFRKRGIRFNDIEGELVPEEDEQGRTLYEPRKGDIQTDPKTGKAFRMDRDQYGMEKRVDPDAEAAIEEDDLDPHMLVKRNKFGPEERIDPAEGIRAESPVIRVKSAKALHAKAIDEIEYQMKGIERLTASEREKAMEELEAARTPMEAPVPRKGLFGGEKPIPQEDQDAYSEQERVRMEKVAELEARIAGDDQYRKLEARKTEFTHGRITPAEILKAGGIPEVGAGGAAAPSQAQAASPQPQATPEQAKASAPAPVQKALRPTIGGMPDNRPVEASPLLPEQHGNALDLHAREFSDPEAMARATDIGKGAESRFSEANVAADLDPNAAEERKGSAPTIIEAPDLAARKITGTEADSREREVKAIKRARDAIRRDPVAGKPLNEIDRLDRDFTMYSESVAANKDFDDKTKAEVMAAKRAAFVSERRRLAGKARAALGKRDEMIGDLTGISGEANQKIDELREAAKQRATVDVSMGQHIPASEIERDKANRKATLAELAQVEKKRDADMVAAALKAGYDEKGARAIVDDIGKSEFRNDEDSVRLSNGRILVNPKLMWNKDLAEGAIVGADTTSDRERQEAREALDAMLSDPQV